MMQNSTWSGPELPFLGYNYSSAVGGQAIPQRLQNLCIRDYAANKKLPLNFSVSEYADEHETLMLFAQLPKLDRISGFIFYSFLLLPSEPAKRSQFLIAVLSAGKQIHFALEDLSMTQLSDIDSIDRMYRITRDRRLADSRESVLAFKKAGNETSNRS
jgi:sporadic carbohydrate cluster protein (TIGR04323 family)